MLMSDGTVLCGDGGQGWYRLTPDIHGNYVNGTWTNAAATKYTRLFYSSDVLTNGFLYVAGGEYGTGRAHAELYNPLVNTWSDIPQPASDPGYSDAVSKLLPNGTVLQGTTGGGCWIYNPNNNTITATATARNQNEACWVRLTNDTVLTIDAFGTQSEHYSPSTASWVTDGNVPVSLYGYGGEMGAGFVLPNGKVFYIGGTTHTAIYTPPTTVSGAGTWVAGPEMIFGGTGLGAVDAPAAMMPNGKIICALGPTNGFSSPTSFYEYDYTINGFTQVNGPTGLTINSAPFVMTFLQLPDGNMLFVSGQGSTSLYVYFPDGTPLAMGQPTINSITENTDGSYHLLGTGLNGISAGAAYGDDWQMDSNYPLIRMTNNVTGNVYYARTYAWNNTTIMTGSKVTSTEFTLPPNLPAGTYSLVVTANGNPSAAQTFTYAPPSAPTGLNATIGNSQLKLGWNPVAGATAYNLKRSTTSGQYFLPIATVTGTNFTNTGLTNGVTYYYVVSAVGSGGPSTNSPQLAASPFGPPPAPTSLTAGPDSYLGINLDWNASIAATNYNVKRSTTSGGPYTTIATRPNTDYDDTNVVAGTTYYYVVSALSAGGESVNSTQASATPSGSGDVTTGMVANWHLDETTGTTTADSSPFGNTGTLVNNPTWVTPGRIGASDLSFVDTSSQSITVNNAASLNMTAGITIGAWINPVDWAGNRRILQKGNSDNQYRLLVEGGALKFHLNGVNSVTGTLPSSNVWTYVAGTWDGSTMKLYTNGVLQASLAAGGSIATTADPLAIAKKNTGTATGDYFSGQLDEIRLYNRALAVTEINTIMHAGDAAPSTPTGLAAVPGNASVGLTWTPSSAASSYNVKRSLSIAGPFDTIGSPVSAAYTDAGLTNGLTYYYVVSAVNSTSESLNSTPVSAIPGVGVSFFADADYGGAGSRILAAGNYTLAQLIAAGVANDTASSCKIPGGWTVIIYQNDNFGGSFWTLNADTPSFAGYGGLNDNMSSCKIAAGTIPGLPGGLVGTISNAQVTLSWSASSGATGYKVKRSTTSGGPYTTIAQTVGTGYADTGLLNGTTYYYVVSAFNATGESANSAQIARTPIAPPAAPTGLATTSGNAQVSLSWDPTATATSYNVKRANASGGPYVLVGTPTTTNFSDAGLTNFVLYYYVVSASNAGGESGNSSEVQNMPASSPVAPSGLVASAGNRQAALSWNASTFATGYNVKRSATAGGPYDTIATTAATNYLDSGLTNELNYFYVVSATNSLGESPNSAEAAVMPFAPPIFLTVLPFTNGQFSFTFQGVDGQNYTVFSSSNLVDWAPLLTNVQSGGFFLYTETNATDAAKFYRVKQ
jgi:fibronectin type 3 domain-containing protein